MSLRISSIIIIFVIVISVVVFVVWPRTQTLEPNPYRHVNQNIATYNTNVYNANASPEIDWESIVAQSVSTSTVRFNGLTFQVPQVMKKMVMDGSTTFTFPVDIPEGPYIMFSTSTKTSDQLVAEKKANMSQFETVVQDTTKTINGISWRIFEQTTDFGINQVTWMAKQSPTVVVSFTGTRDDVAAVLLKIVESGNKT